MTFDSHNDLVGRGFTAAYLGLMGLMITVSSDRLPHRAALALELVLGGVAIVGLAMIAIGHAARVDENRE